MYSWGGREKQLADLPPGGEKALNASMSQAIASDVEPSASDGFPKKGDDTLPPGGQKALNASMKQAITSDVEPAARK
jgi:hypothetical protein